MFEKKYNPLHNLIKTASVAVLGIFVTIGLTGCDLGADLDSPATFEVLMHDAPTDDLEQFNVHVKSIEAQRAGGGWTTIGEPDEVYNLLELVNGNKVVLGEEEVESGRYTQVRLILGEDNSVLNKDGEVSNLSVPSGAQTGIKLIINADLQEGVRYTLNLDFDASRSLIKTGESPNINYVLNPVIRAYEEALTGTIGGVVEPAEAAARIDAIVDDTVFTSTYADENGGFLLIGLEPQSYQIVIEATEGDYETETREDIEVVAGENYDLGTIELTGSEEESEE